MEEMVAGVTEDHLFQVVELFLCLLDSRFVLLGDGGSQREFCVTGALVQRSIRSGVKFLLFRKAKIQSIDRLWIESRPKLNTRDNKLRLASQQQQQHAKSKGISSVLPIITTITSSFIAVSQLTFSSLSSHLLPLSFFFLQTASHNPTKQNNLFPRS